MRALWAMALLPAVLGLTGCSSPDVPPECGGGKATVSAHDLAGHRWLTTLDAPTQDPPRIGDGYVLVRDDCGYSVLDLTDGHVVEHGDETGAVGVADGFLYLVTHDDSTHSTTVEGKPVVGDDVDGLSGMSSLYSGNPDVTAYVVGGSLYVATEQYLEMYDAKGEPGWQSPLPILRNPALTDVGDLVIVTSAEGSVYALDKNSGEALWRTTVPEVASSYTLTAHRRGALVDVNVGALSGGATELELSVQDGHIVRTRAPGPAPAEPLTATSDGWTVVIDSDPVPHRVD